MAFHPPPHTIVGDVETVLRAMFGPQQHDAHVMMWRFILFHRGTSRRWHELRGFR